MGDCRCDLSLVNSKFHITVFSLIRFQELLSVCKMVLLQSKITSLVLMQRLVQVFNLKKLISAQLGNGVCQWQRPFKARSNVEVHFPTW